MKTAVSLRLTRAPNRIRIIGGRYRRRWIPVTDRVQLRPTPDRVRETLFNWLAHLYPDPAPLRGLDLFAGTGALGFELASRGAQRVVLIEHDVALVAALIALRERLGASEVQVIRGDAIEVAGGLPSAAFDVIFVDPPYEVPLLRPALATARRLLAAGGAIYAEAPTVLPEADLRAQGLQVLRTGRAGRVHFHLLAAHPP